MYIDIVKEFSRAKESNDKQVIIKALIFFVDKIRKSLEENPDLKTFVDFIKDEHFIFRTKKEVYSENSANVEIATFGLLSELLDTCSVNDSHIISEQIKEAIFEIHSHLSRGMNIEEEKNKLNKYLKNLSDTTNSNL